MSVKLSKSGVVPFTQVPNCLLNDNTISLKAKGLYAFMVSKPDGWNFTLKSMSSQLKEGVDALSGAIKELKNNGYMSYKKHTDGSGEYLIYFEPNTENPNLENPNLENAQCINNKDISKKKDIYKKEKVVKKKKFESMLLEAFAKNRILSFKQKLNFAKAADVIKAYDIKSDKFGDIAKEYAAYVSRNKNKASRLDRFICAYAEGRVDSIENASLFSDEKSIFDKMREKEIAYRKSLSGGEEAELC